MVSTANLAIDGIVLNGYINLSLDLIGFLRVDSLPMRDTVDYCWLRSKSGKSVNDYSRTPEGMYRLFSPR